MKCILYSISQGRKCTTDDNDQGGKVVTCVFFMRVCELELKLEREFRTKGSNANFSFSLRFQVLGSL